MRLLRALQVLAAVTALLAAALLALNWAYPPPPWPVDHSVEVRDADGGLLRLYTNSAGYWRLPAQLPRLDPRFVTMLLAYEDQRFYRHPGVDPLALLRAAGQWLRHGRVVSGGSTLTMQLVRLMDPRPRTLGAKLLQMLRALQLEYHLSKTAILTRYLTLAPYGGNLQGVRAASLFYFGKEPGFLSLAEAALLVALPQSPERRRPDRHPQRAREARDAVLDRLLAAGLLDSEQVQAAGQQPVPSTRRPTPRRAPHLSDRLRSAYPNKQLIRTTLDGALQARLEALLADTQAGLGDGIAVAAMVIDNRRATVSAYVGSGDYFSARAAGQLDMVRALRSPGSALKPFVYGLGFDAGLIHPETLIADRDRPVGGYAPGNFDHRYQGEITVRRALQSSRNVPAVRVLQRLRPTRLLAALRHAGVNPKLPGRRPGLPIALGGIGITLEQLAALYTALAHQGELHWPRLLADAEARPPRRLLTPTAAWYLGDILRGVPMPGGFLPQSDIAFKTGTSYGYRDAWAVGYDAGHTVALWLGRPDGGYTSGLNGIGSAVPVMLSIFAQLPAPGLQALLSDPPAGVLRVDNSGLPPRLRRFTKDTGTTEAGPHIDYPPAGAEIAVTDGEPLRLKVSAGVGPFHWLANGRLLGSAQGRSLDWTPPSGQGRYRLTVIDSLGHSATSRFSIHPRQ